MKRLALVVAVILIIACGRQDAPDLQEYISEIRAAGMSEKARGDVYLVASIRSGQRFLSFPYNRATGSYQTSYHKARYPQRERTPKQVREFQQGLHQSTMAELERLKPYADLDGSGFVSTDEARRFRALFEFGLKASYILQQENHVNIDKLARALGLPRELVAADAEAYKDLRERMAPLGGEPLPDLSL